MADKPPYDTSKYYDIPTMLKRGWTEYQISLYFPRVKDKRELFEIKIVHKNEEHLKRFC